MLDGPLGIGPGRIVIEVASSRQKYGRLAAFYDDHPFFAFEEGLLAAYAQSAAAALDAATALDQARRRGAATAALLRLARSLSEPASPAGSPASWPGRWSRSSTSRPTAVMLWDEERTALRVVGRSGWPVGDHARSSTRSSSRPRRSGTSSALLEADGARIVQLDGASTNPIVAELAPARLPDRRGGADPRATRASSSGSPSRR